MARSFFQPSARPPLPTSEILMPIPPCADSRCGLIWPSALSALPPICPAKKGKNVSTHRARITEWARLKFFFLRSKAGSRVAAHLDATPRFPLLTSYSHRGLILQSNLSQRQVNQLAQPVVGDLNELTEFTHITCINSGTEPAERGSAPRARMRIEKDIFASLVIALIQSTYHRY